MPYADIEKRRAFQRSINKPVQEFIARAKAKPCTDCHILYPSCAMQFDHRDGKTKSFCLSRFPTRKLDKIQAEIDKCDVVCANCHAIRTYNRRHSNAVC